MPSTVVHCKKEEYDVYVGRPGYWGNPFIIGKDGDRDEVIQKFRDFVTSDNIYAQEMRVRLYELQDKVLGCWCAPEPCHADVLAELANQLPPKAPPTIDKRSLL